jgi:hypothetical protein
MSNHADEIATLRALKFRVTPVGKGEKNPSTMYRVRKGARGRDSYLNEQQLVELYEQERRRAESKGRRRNSES